MQQDYLAPIVRKECHMKFNNSSKKVKGTQMLI